MAQKPPQRVEALSLRETKAAVFIFLHGFGDDADGVINVAHQFQAAQKLPHLTWIFPNAPQNHESMTTAWYNPTAFSPIPVGKSSAKVGSDQDEDDDEDEEDEQGILKSIEYVCTIIDDEVEKGISPERVILGGFSQGCAVSLSLGLGSSRYAGKLAGIVGLSGYLPLKKRIRRGRKTYRDDGKNMKIFLGHGTKDQLVPIRIFRDHKLKIERMVGEGSVEAHEYNGMGHVMSGSELNSVCLFLEAIV